jgi:hypothetical protein
VAAKLHFFLIWAIDAGECSALFSGQISLGERIPATYWREYWMEFSKNKYWKFASTKRRI